MKKMTYFIDNGIFISPLCSTVRKFEKEITDLVHDKTRHLKTVARIYGNSSLLFIVVFIKLKPYPVLK